VVYFHPFLRSHPFSDGFPLVGYEAQATFSSFLEPTVYTLRCFLCFTSRSSYVLDYNISVLARVGLVSGVG
jgi:hypothetical protein